MSGIRSKKTEVQERWPFLKMVSDFRIVDKSFSTLFSSYYAHLFRRLDHIFISSTGFICIEWS